jgi:cytochrome c biogenesis protein CcdA
MSISPCPLASNVAAVSFIGKKLGGRGSALLAGTAYTVGRMTAYLAIGAVLVTGILSVPSLARFLQGSMTRIMGPILILVGLLLLKIVRLPFPAVGAGDRVHYLAGQGGIWGAWLLGILLSLSFCPISAGLFFGSLIPMAVRHHSRLLFPAVFGVGTAIPVALFAIVLSLGTNFLARAFDRVAQFERWAGRITGVVFVIAGLYYVLSYWFGISMWG